MSRSGAVLFLLSAVLPPLASAQQAAQSVRVGETTLTPEVRLDYVSTDNFFRSANNAQEATGFIVSPGIAWKADQRSLSLDAFYRGSYGFYSEEAGDFDDHRLGVSSTAQINSRRRIEGSFNVSRIHESLGTGQTADFAGTIDDQIVNTTVSAVGSFVYGAQDARGNVIARLELSDSSFSNLEQFTAGDDFFRIRPSVRFSYRISPDLRWIAEARFATLDFDDNGRDRTEATVLTGVTINAGDKTGGEATVGVLQADFDSAGVPSRTELISEVNVFYRPVSFSRLDIAYSREFTTVDGTDTSVGESVLNSARLGWRHSWSTRIDTSASLGLLQYDRECPRSDSDTVTVGLEFNVNVRRWLDLGFSLSRSERNVSACDPSQDASLGYELFGGGFYVRATL